VDVTLSVVVITQNEEANIGRTLASVQPLTQAGGETIVVDCGSTDGTVGIAQALGAKVFLEDWKGFAAQKNSAIAKASCDWVLSLDADEVVTEDLRAEIEQVLASPDTEINGYWVPRMNYILGRWIRHGGFWPDPKLRLFRLGTGRFVDRPVHETIQIDGELGHLIEPIFHEAYPTISSYIEHMNRYSSLGAELAAQKGQIRFTLLNILLRPLGTFIYNYVIRGGFLDGREGLLLHLYHAVYVSWKYAKAWELGRQREVKVNG
jgi:glycosyltransferase involved in cell wall biosynthesis